MVYVRTRGQNQRGETVLQYVRWVMVHKRDFGVAAPAPVVPDLTSAVAASDLVVPQGLDFSGYDFVQAGETHRWSDYQIGEKIDHVDGVTAEEAEHMMATRLWQNTSKVHFDSTLRADGQRLVYGGYVISMARSLSFNGLANAQMIVALNAGTHANPCYSGTTIKACPKCWTGRKLMRPAWLPCACGWWRYKATLQNLFTKLQKENIITTFF